MFTSKADVIALRKSLALVTSKQLTFIDQLRAMETRLNDFIPAHEIESQQKRLDTVEQEIDEIDKSVQDAREKIAEQKGVLSALQYGGSTQEKIVIHNTPVSGNDTQLNQAENLSNVDKNTNE